MTEDKDASITEAGAKQTHEEARQMQQQKQSIPSGNGPFAEPKSIHDISDCFFYHAIDLPGLGYIPGEWDLRKGIKNYLGNVKLTGKNILDVGAATGFISFYMESQGAAVTAFDVNEDYLLDYIPFAQHDYVGFSIANKPNIRKMNNSFWFCHSKLNSHVKMIYGTVYALPEGIGLFDMSTFGCILLHLRDPFIALHNVLRHTKETVIITLPHPSIYFPSDYLKNLDKPFMIFMPDQKRKENLDFCTWWAFTPEIIKHFIGILGFEDVAINYHFQNNRDRQFQLYTIVGKRTIPIK
jgi:SAM-dependent methyltransferase